MIALVCGLSHNTAPLEIRERLAFSPSQAKAALAQLPPSIKHGVILSTCNRSEVYGVAQNISRVKKELQVFLARSKGMEASWFSPYLYVHEGGGAIRHLFRVVSGIDSMVLGEDQIQGQVRQALNMALEAGTASRPLSFLFRRAIEVGKRCRRQTLISRYAVSISRASILLAKRHLGELKERSILLISAGETGELTTKIVRESGAGRLLVANRTYDRAVELAQRFGAEAIPFEKLGLALAMTDIVISSTSAPDFILHPEMVEAAMAQRNDRPLFLVDIAVPRDIDPQVKDIANVFLYNLDDLQVISQAGLGERRKEAVKVEAIIEEEVGRAMKWWRQEIVVPTIVALQDKAEALRRREVARGLKKLSSLSPEGEAQVDTLTKAIIKKLLHHPLNHLKQDSQYQQLVQELFDLPQADQKP